MVLRGCFADKKLKPDPAENLTSMLEAESRTERALSNLSKNIMFLKDTLDYFLCLRN